MNFKRKTEITILALLLTVSCGSSGGGNNPSNSATPTNNNVPVTSNVEPQKNPNLVGDIQYDPNNYNVISDKNIGAVSTTSSYVREMPTVGVLKNQRYNANGQINWNETKRTYVSANPDNKPQNTAFTGEGVKVGVIDAGFNQRYNELLGLSPNAEKVLTLSTDGDAHGINVVKNLLGISPKAKLYVVDAAESGYVNPKAEHFWQLYNKGVRIFSNSYGITSIKNNPHVILGTQNYEFLKEAVKGGSLFVWSGGNVDSINHGGAIGNFPRLDAELEKGWINVVGLVTKGYTRDFSFGNLKVLSPAGSSKNWTISAVGVQTTVNGNEVATSFGASFAAPKVTATAALLKQKYPFMTGDLLRQTILSTATDIGDPGVDDVYGWGLLDVEKALKGPALFDKRLALGEKVNITLDGGSYSFDNDISGDAGLNLNGSGILTLNGKTTYTGETTVGAGAYLKIRKNSSSRMLLENNAKLSIENASVPEVSSNGTLITKGNVEIKKLTSTSEIITDVNTNIKTENAELEGKIKVTNENGEYFSKKGRTATLITGNVSGNAMVETSSELLEAKTDTNSEGIQATVSRKDVSEYAKDSGADEQQKNTSKQIETTLEQVDTLADNGTATSEILSNAAQLQLLNSNTLDSMSGQIYASAQALTFEQSETVNRDLSNRMSDLARSLENDKKFGLWTSGIFSKGNIEKSGFAKGKTTVKGGQVGFDMKVTDSAIVGVAIDYSKGKVKFDRYNGESKADMTGFSLYGRQNFGNTYVAGRLGFGYSDTEVKRDIIVNNNISEHSKIIHKDKSLSTYFESGYDIKLNGDFMFTPYVALGTDKVTRGKFSESNTNFGMTADKKSYNMPYATIGTKVVKKFGNTDITGYIGYTKGLNKKDLNFEAAYNFAPEAKFEVKGINYSRNKVNAGFGIKTEIKEGLNWYANYDYKHSTDKSKSDNHMITTGVRIEF